MHIFIDRTSLFLVVIFALFIYFNERYKNLSRLEIDKSMKNIEMISQTKSQRKVGLVIT